MEGWTEEMAPVSGLARALERGDATALEGVLRRDVVLRSPLSVEPHRGRSIILRVLGAVLPRFDDFRFVHRLEGDRYQVVRFTARLGGQGIEGVGTMYLDRAGLATELTLLVRPLDALTAVDEAVRAALATSTTR